MSISQEKPGSMCKVVRLSYNGGLIGLFSNRAAVLEHTVNNWAAQGYTLTHVLPAKPSIGAVIIQVLLLMITLCLFTLEPGETLLFQMRR